MTFVRQSLKTRPPFGELGDPPLPDNSTVLYEEEYGPKPIKKSHGKQIEQEQLATSNDEKRILKVSSEKDLSHADFIERLIVEASYKKQRRSSSKNSYQIDDFLQDKDNDWFFEKILAKFESVRSKNNRRYESSSPSNDFDEGAYGVERIVERRYYVKKARSVSKRDRLTSTSDLRNFGKKNRQLSGVSSATAATTCSQCSSSTPTYVENLRDQSDILRDEISELKNEIEHLQASQEQFFQQLRTQFQSKTNLTTTTSPNSVRPTISPIQSPSEKDKKVGNTAIPLSASQQPRSVSIESLTTSSSVSTTTSGKSTPTSKPAAKPIAVPSSVPVASSPSISEFTASKNPSIVPTSPVTTYVARKSPSVAPTPPISEFVVSKNPSIASVPSVIAPIGPIASRTSSVGPTPPIAPPLPVNPLTVTKPPMASPTGPVPLSMPSTRTPVYGNEMAHRRVLSPRSQIVASSASAQDSSESSSESITPDVADSKPQKISKVPVMALRDNDLKDLVQYSSQLELSGYRPSTTAIMSNPNTSGQFWKSVDQYIENHKSANLVTGLPPIPRSNHGSRLGLNNGTTRQLDKYDLEIKPQRIIESSAPLLMPPLDISP